MRELCPIRTWDSEELTVAGYLATSLGRDLDGIYEFPFMELILAPTVLWVRPWELLSLREKCGKQLSQEQGCFHQGSLTQLGDVQVSLQPWLWSAHSPTGAGWRDPG